MVKIIEKTKAKSIEKRPWGSFEILHETDIEGLGNKIKRLTILPGEKLSLQVHQHRAEHWLIEEGVAKVTIDSKIDYMGIGDKVDIPKGTMHRIENDTNNILKVLEIQTGDILAESDILRIDDKYGRN